MARESETDVVAHAIQSDSTPTLTLKRPNPPQKHNLTSRSRSGAMRKGRDAVENSESLKGQGEHLQVQENKEEEERRGQCKKGRGG